jgi:hypothetical protein
VKAKAVTMSLKRVGMIVLKAFTMRIAREMGKRQ